MILLPMPNHPCSPFCKPDEGIHCIPNAWYPDMTLRDFQAEIKSFEIVEIRRENDVSPKMVENLGKLNPTYYCKPMRPGYVGYLLFMKERERSERGLGWQR